MRRQGGNHLHLLLYEEGYVCAQSHWNPIPMEAVQSKEERIVESIVLVIQQVWRGGALPLPLGNGNDN